MKHSFAEINIEEQSSTTHLKAFNHIYQIERTSSVKKWTIGIFILLVVVLFLPWTQNIRAKGNVTTLRQEQRPQELNTILAGRVVKWYVKEGDFVKAGDTILQLGEVKVDYFDPELLGRTQQQIVAKQQSVEGYKGKAATAQTQVGALSEGQQLKLQSLDNKIAQQQLKVASDSIDLIAVTNELSVAKRQIDAAKNMLDSGAISLVDFERRKVSYQNAQAKRLGTENKYLQGKQELTNLHIEKNSTIQDYIDKISKAQGERYSSLSNAASTEADIAKLQNIYASYDIRNKLYYITAPQSGQIVKAKKAGIGEMLKEGEMIVQIVPTSMQYAVEIFVEPMDLPLVNAGQKVRFIFDGFPAIVFSGWPNTSYGTFGGVVTAVENNVSTNGKFRVLVAEDNSDRPWPKALRMGGGANAIALLKDVPIYYELWRNINGFPPEYYKPSDKKADDGSAKKEK
jgi:multidrug efflux pump subunit AcrA (membrane-fusion protein)